MNSFALRYGWFLCINNFAFLFRLRGGRRKVTVFKQSLSKNVYPITPLMTLVLRIMCYKVLFNVKLKFVRTAKSTENVASMIESSIYCAKVRDLRVKIINEMTAIM